MVVSQGSHWNFLVGVWLPLCILDAPPLLSFIFDYKQCNNTAFEVCVNSCTFRQGAMVNFHQQMSQLFSVDLYGQLCCGFLCLQKNLLMSGLWWGFLKHVYGLCNKVSFQICSKKSLEIPPYHVPFAWIRTVTVYSSSFLKVSLRPF